MNTFNNEDLENIKKEIYRKLGSNIELNIDFVDKISVLRRFFMAKIIPADNDHDKGIFKLPRTGPKGRPKLSQTQLNLLKEYIEWDRCW